jgi:hypothetical protein
VSGALPVHHSDLIRRAALGKTLIERLLIPNLGMGAFAEKRKPTWGDK